MWGFPKRHWAMTRHKAVTICECFLLGWLFSSRKLFQLYDWKLYICFVAEQNGVLGFQDLVLKLAFDSFAFNNSSSSPCFPHHHFQLWLMSQNPYFPLHGISKEENFCFLPDGKGSILWSKRSEKRILGITAHFNEVQLGILGSFVPLFKDSLMPLVQCRDFNCLALVSLLLQFPLTC